MSFSRTFCLTLSLAALVALPIACGSDDDGGSEFGKTGGASGTGGGSNDAAISPDSGSGGSGATGGDCSDYGQGTDCELCLDQSCCAPAGACEDDANCAAMVECARQCPDPTDGASNCVQDCADANGGGGQLYNAVVVCMGQQCGEVCPFL